MFAVIGITGQVGGVVARTLLDVGQRVRAVVRSVDKGKNWAQQGCEIAVADLNDPAALQGALQGVTGVFVMLPPVYSPSKDFIETRRIVEALSIALEAAKPAKVVCLSTVGAQATQPNLLNGLGIMEQSLSRLSVPVAFLRAAWFMENAAWDVPAAKEKGIIPSFLQPLDKPIPMVATADIGRVAAETLQENWNGPRIIELEGPHRVSPNDIANSFSKILQKPVRMEAVPHQQWEGIFRAQGTDNPLPRIQMLDGFNEGWITFEHEAKKGIVSLDTVIAKLVTPEQQADTIQMEYCDDLKCYNQKPCPVHAMKCGGFGSTREGDAEVQALCDQIRAEALSRAQRSGWNGLFTEFKALEFTTQVVAGVNFLVKVQTSGKPSYVHVKIHRPLPHTQNPPSVMSIELNKAREDPL